MESLLDFSLVPLVPVFGVLLCGARRLRSLIRLYALQSAVLLIASPGLYLEVAQQPAALLLLLYTLAVKCALLPFALSKLRAIDPTRRESPRGVGALMLAGGLVGISHHAARSIRPELGGAVAAALATVLLAMYLVVRRRNPMSQLVGLLAIENGTALLIIATGTLSPMVVFSEIAIHISLVVVVLTLGLPWVATALLDDRPQSAEVQS